MNMVVKAVFFDVSDTLYNNPEFEDAQSRQAIILLGERRGISYDEARDLFARTKARLKDKSVHVTKGAVLKEFGISKMELHDALSAVVPKQYVNPDERLAQMLYRLHNRFELGVITNIRERLLNDILDALQVDKACFRHIVSVDNTTHSKPDIEPFMKAMKLCGFEPDECVYVGDSLTKDMVPAKRAGMRTMWVSREAGHTDSVDACAGSIYDVEEAISRLYCGG
ncbi:MAG: HAD family hydrolase [archaeon]